MHVPMPLGAAPKNPTSTFPSPAAVVAPALKWWSQTGWPPIKPILSVYANMQWCWCCAAGGRHVVCGAGSEDNTVRLWNASGACLQVRGTGWLDGCNSSSLHAYVCVDWVGGWVGWDGWVGGQKAGSWENCPPVISPVLTALPHQPGQHPYDTAHAHTYPAAFASGSLMQRQSVPPVCPCDYVLSHSQAVATVCLCLLSGA